MLSLISRIGLGQEKESFMENLAMLMESGMDMASAMASLKKDLRSRRMKKVIEEIEKEIDAGMTLSAALERTGLFKPHAIALLNIGEESGKLSENLTLIAQQEHTEKLLHSKIRSALAYPAFIIVLTLTLGLGIAWFILPKLALVFDKLRVPLPLITKILIGIGNFLGEYGSIAVPLALCLMATVLFLFFGFTKTNFIGDALFFRIPGIKTLLQEVELARFGSLLGTLIKAGIPIKNALDSLCQATSFRRYRNFYITLRDRIEEGNSFQKSFSLDPKSEQNIPFSLQSMIAAGEKSGRLTQVFTKIGEMFEAKTEMTTKNLLAILEPLLLIIVWLGVVSVALAIILPIYTLVGSLNS